MSEGREEPSWVDYSNLAANLIQVGQLSAVQRRLKQLAEIEAAHEEHERLINELRQIVFEAENNLQRIEEYIDKAPEGVFIAISLLEAAFDKMGIVPQTFEEFTDKDRIQHVQGLIHAKLNDASQNLSAEQYSEAQQMLQLALKLNDLEILISAYDAAQGLANIDGEWKQLEELRKQTARPWRDLFIISSTILAIDVPFSIALWMIITTINFGNSKIMTLVAIGSVLIFLFASTVLCVFILSAITGIIGMIIASPQRFLEAKKQRTALIKRLLPQEKLRKLQAEFGSRSSKEYKELRNEVLKYMKRVTNRDKDGINLPDSIVSIVMPKSITKL